MTAGPRLRSHARRQLDRLTGQALLLYPEGALELSPTADAILNLCDGRRTVEEIGAALAAEFTVEPGEIVGDVGEFLAELARRGLLETP